MTSPFKRMSPTVMSPSVAAPPGLWNARPFAGVTPPIAVLIVDDDSAGAEALAAALATEGFRTIVAVGGTCRLSNGTCVDAARRHPQHRNARQ